eukprot:scaffold10475_cov69-Cylindrotheca_fusiformis.AAC.1
MSKRPISYDGIAWGGILKTILARQSPVEMFAQHAPPTVPQRPSHEGQLSHDEGPGSRPVRIFDKT